MAGVKGGGWAKEGQSLYDQKVALAHLGRGDPRYDEAAFLFWRWVRRNHQRILKELKK